MESKPQKFLLPDVFQIGIVTNDLDKSIKEMEDLYGLKPFKIFEPEYINTYVRGKPAPIKLKAAFFRGTDKVDIEVIAVKESGTVLDEWLREKGAGINHLAFEVQGIEEWVDYYKKKGVEVLQRGDRPGVKFVYLDTHSRSGFITELVERFK
jgi:catechol 2,3-dioxygenase-like lactoylglutathione lyase family enzyme